MIHDLNPYSIYKDSGLPWLGQIPEHWELRRAKCLFRKMDRPANYSDGVVTCFRDGVVTLRKNRRSRGFTESIKEIGYQGIRRGDLVIHAMDAFAGAIGVSDSDGKGTPVYSVCAPSPNANAHYFAYIVREMARAQWILALAKGIRERSTDFRFESGFAPQQVPLPPLDEQLTIVRYLAYADRRIQRYIRAKKKLVALLNEQKQAIINRAVTRGLEPNLPYKPSGMDQGVSPQAEARLAEDGAWGVLKAGCVNRGIFLDTEHKRLPNGFVVDETLAIKVGDLLVSRASGSPHLVGSAGRVKNLRYRLILSDKIFRLVVRVEEMTDFLGAVMTSPYFRSQVEQSISGAEGLANNLPLSALKDFHIAVPPLAEAKRISSNLELQVRHLNNMITNILHGISLLMEYRSRLIADVVTGKLDVREAAAQLPEVGEERSEENEPLTEDEEDSEEGLDEATDEAKD